MALQRSAITARVPLWRAVLLAAALTALAELALYRVVLPIVSHVPGSGPSALTRGLQLAAERSFEATAVLVLVGAALLAWARLRQDPATAVALIAALASVVAATAFSEGWAALAARVVLLASVLVVAVGAWVQPLRSSLAMRSAVAAAAVVVVAGQWPLLVEDVATVARGLQGASPAVGTTVGELALLCTPMLLALAYVQRRSPPNTAWVAAGAAALLTGALFAMRPDDTAIVSLWAVGVTLSLPAALYIVSASCAAFVLAGWLAESSTRPLAAGLVLLAVSGLQPAVVHHNLTAVVALALLAMPLVSAGHAIAPRARRAHVPMVAELGGRP